MNLTDIGLSIIGGFIIGLFVGAFLEYLAYKNGLLDDGKEAMV